MKNIIVKAEDLTVRYRQGNRDCLALNKVNFSLCAGEILAVVGESGSGKTTLALSLLNLLGEVAEYRGRVIFSGKDIFSFSPRQWQKLRGKNIGLIMQEPAAAFNPVLSVGYQFRELLNRHLDPGNGSRARDIIYRSLEWAQLFEADRILRSYPFQLSGGQLQRVSIAMAIALNPGLIIADEPTSSLDVTVESRVINLFSRLREELGIAMIFITHNLDLVKDLCDRVCVLYRGEVRETDTAEKIFASPQDEYTKQLILSLRELQ